MTRILDDYLLGLRTQLLHLPYGDQDAVMAEVRAHLESDMADRRRRDPRLSDDELALQATAAFGAPDELTVRFGPSGGLVRKSTGEVLLRAAVLTGRAAKATGRGVRTLLKWTGITAAVLLGVALVLVIVAAFVGTNLATTYHDQIAESIPHPVYSYSGAWGVSDAQANIKTDPFAVPSDSRELRIRFTTAPTSGCIAIQLTSPSGKVTMVNGNGCSAFNQESSYAETGEWRVQYTFVGYAGSLSAHAEAYQKA
jgi:hypothetical protein